MHTPYNPRSFVRPGRAVLALGLLALHTTACSGDDTGGNTAKEVGDSGSTGGASTGGGSSAGGAAASGGATSSGGAASGAGGAATGGSGSGGKGTGGGAAMGTGGTPPAAGDWSTAPKKPVAPTCTVTADAAPAAAWKNVTGNLAGMASECGNLTLVAADPCSKKVIAGVAKGGLFASEGGAWTKLGSGTGSATIVHRPSSVVFDPEHADTFYESGIYGSFSDGLFKTTDGGVTFKQLGNVGHNDLISVDFTDPERKTLLAGAHETKRKLWLSKDAGATWTDIGMKLPADSHFSVAPLVLDKFHFLLGACGYGDGTCGVYLSADGGDTWASASKESAAGRPLWAADGHMLWTTIYNSGVILSEDVGKTWTKVGGPHTGFPAELPDGRVVGVGGDHLLVSSDHGKTWTNLGETLPFAAGGVTYSPGMKAFYVWHGDCNNAVLADAVASAGFDWEK